MSLIEGFESSAQGFCISQAIHIIVWNDIPYETHIAIRWNPVMWMLYKETYTKTLYGETMVEPSFWIRFVSYITLSPMWTSTRYEVRVRRLGRLFAAGTPQECHTSHFGGKKAAIANIFANIQSCISKSLVMSLFGNFIIEIEKHWPW